MGKKQNKEKRIGLEEQKPEKKSENGDRRGHHEFTFETFWFDSCFKR